MRRMILIPLLICLASLAIAGGIGYWFYDNYVYYRTDDAQITGPLIGVNAPTTGKVIALKVKQGDTVIAGQTIALLATAAPTGTLLTVTSPLDGVVLQVPVIQGQLVTPDMPLAHITNLKAVNVTAYVDESAINSVQIGQDVDIHIDSYSDISFTGKVQQIIKATADQFSLLPIQDNANNNFIRVGQHIPVIISLNGTGGKDVLPGMSVEVTLHIH